MNEQDLADLLCCAERRMRELREAYLDEGKDWRRGDNGRIEYTPEGVIAMKVALGLDVAETAQDAPGAIEGVSGQGEAALKGKDVAPDAGDGKKTETRPMVCASIVRCLPNARVYVAQVVGTRRIVRLRTKVRMGLKKGRKLMCLDLGSELVFDRTAARMFGRL
jgi:hypothetical protein